MKNFFSPLRYPGGKAKLSNYLYSLYEKNNLYDGYYIEPYAGGASVGLSLLFNEYASKIVINDFDQAIYNFWYSTLYFTEELCKKIYDTKINMNTWIEQKNIYLSQSNFSQLEIGFATFFLNRTNRSGILNAGVIGGKKQDGFWKMDARYNKKDLIQRIQKIGRYADRIELHNLDALKLLSKISSKVPTNSLFYFDPPYFVKGKDLYKNFYNPKDHQLVANSIQSLKHHWIVTYDSIPEIWELYKSNRKFEYHLNYSAANPKKGSEVFIFGDSLMMPEKEIKS